MDQDKLVNAFTGSMNMDTNPTFLKEGDYVMARNVRVGYSESDNMGCVENIRGTLEITNKFLTDRAGRWKTVGAAVFEAGSKIYQLRKDTVGNEDFIEEFDLLTRSFTKVLSGDLSFSDKIYTARYLNDMLFWNDGLSDPRQISVSLAKAGYAYTQANTNTLIKFPPDAAMTGVVSISSPLTSSALGPNQYQFIYRYVFVNNQRSVWSIPSNQIVVPTDQYDHIRLSFPSSHVATANLYTGFIKYIEIGFRDDTSLPWYFFKRIDFPKTKPTGTSLFYLDFKNDVQYQAIASDETDQPYSDVPVKTNDLALVDSRIIMGGNTYGLGASMITLADTGSINDTVVDNGVYKVCGGTYYVGIAVYDPYDRRSFVYPVAVYSHPNRNGIFSPKSPTYRVFGTIPDGYTHWRPVVSNCFNIGNFEQVHIDVVNATSTELRFKVAFVLPTPANYSWVFTKGDKMSLFTSGPGDVAYTREMWGIDFDFDTADGNYVAKGDFTGVSTGALVQLYSPIKGSSTPFYWEIGQTYPVLNNGLGPNGGVFLLPISWGDTVWSDTQKAQIRNVDPAKYDTWFRNSGRANIASQDMQDQKFFGSELAFGDAFVQGTTINNLNNFLSSSKKSYGIELGIIRKLSTVRDFQINGSVLLVTTEYNNYSVYIGKIQLADTDNSSTLIITDQLLGTANLLAGGFGTINPESVHAFGTTARGWDALKGVYWRYSQDGLTPISMEYGANSYSRKLSEDLYSTRNDPKQTSISCFDPFFDEWLVCTRDASKNENPTLAFNETKNGFSAFYDFDPDWMVTVNSLVVSWKNGVLYMHRQSQEYNVLYGERVVSSLSMVFKQSEFDTVNGISLRVYAQDNWSAKVSGIKRNGRSRQVTQMGLTWAQPREDYFDYPITEGTLDKEPMKSRHFVVEMSLDPSVDWMSVIYGAHLTDSISPESITKA